MGAASARSASASTCDVGDDEGRPITATRALHRLGHHRVALEEVAAVHFHRDEAVVARADVGDAAAGRLLVDGHRDRVAVVLDEEDDRRALAARPVEGLVEIALARGALARGDHRDVEVRGLAVAGAVCLAVVAHGREAAAVRLQELGARRRAL
jgi:hypothetical protein